MMNKKFSGQKKYIPLLPVTYQKIMGWPVGKTFIY